MIADLIAELEEWKAVADKLAEACKGIMNDPVGYGDTFDGSVEGGARPVCHECQNKVGVARVALAEYDKAKKGE